MKMKIKISKKGARFSGKLGGWGVKEHSSCVENEKKYNKNWGSEGQKRGISAVELPCGVGT